MKTYIFEKQVKHTNLFDHICNLRFLWKYLRLSAHSIYRKLYSMKLMLRPMSFYLSPSFIWLSPARWCFFNLSQKPFSQQGDVRHPTGFVWNQLPQKT